jgi:uncharacterized protein YjbJ (UPF0337 family)
MAGLYQVKPGHDGEAPPISESLGSARDHFALLTFALRRRGQAWPHLNVRFKLYCPMNGRLAERQSGPRVTSAASRYGPPSGVSIMSGTTDKISGIANEAMGKAKQGVGSVVGSEKLKGEGAAQELKGDAQKAVGDAKNTVKDGANKAADAVNKNL